MKLVAETQHRHCEGGSLSASMGTLRRFRARVFSSVCARVTIEEESDGRARIHKKAHRCPGFEQPCRQASPTRAAGWSKSGGREEHRL